MHATVRSPDVARRWSPRHTRALLCVAAVAMAHAALGWLLSPGDDAPAGRRVGALQVRALRTPAAELAKPGDAMARSAPAAPRLQSGPPVSARVGRAEPSPSRRRVEPPIAAPAAAATAPSIAQVPDAEALETMAAAPPPTRIPAPAELDFVLRRGDESGEARIRWSTDGVHYELQLNAVLPRGRAVEQHSQGTFDDAGLAPLRLADRRKGRDVRAANFQRERGVVSFSGPGWELPLQAGTQDRLSWLVQLVAIAGAMPDGLREGARWTMWVVGARGALSPWRFEVRGREAVGAAQAWWLVREPVHPYDVRVEVWLDPARAHWPVRLRQTQIPGGEPLEWTLRDGAPPGAT